MGALTTPVSAARAPVAPPALLGDVDASYDTLRLGSTGPEVSALQKQLNAAGEKLTVNGSFTPRTAEAVRRFQLTHGIQPANGVVTPRTRRALAALPRTAPVADGFQAASGRPPVVLDASRAPPAPASAVLLTTQDGRKLTVEQGLALLNAVDAKSHNGKLGNQVASLFTGGVLGAEARGLDEQVSRIHQRSQGWLQKGYLTLGERQELAASISGALSTANDLEAHRRRVEGTVAEVGTAAILIGATLATGGAAAPVALAELGATGIVARVGIKGALEGKNYSTKEAVQDAAIGAVEGATSLVGGGAAKGLAARVVQGSLGGAVAGAATTAVRAETWKHGTLDAVKQVASSGASGAVAGGVGGGVVGGAARLLAPRKAVLTLSAEVAQLGQAKAALAQDIAQDIATRSKGKVSEASTVAFLDAYSKARALPESGRIPVDKLALLPKDPEVAGRLFTRAEAYFDLNQRHIQAGRQVAAYGPEASVLATFTSSRGKVTFTSGATQGIDGFAERFSSQVTERAYVQSVADSGRPVAIAERIAHRERWYRDRWLGQSAEQSVGWQQARERATGTYPQWRASQVKIQESGLNFLNGTFSDGQAIQVKPGTEVSFQRLGQAENLGPEVRSVFLGVDQGLGEVELKNAIDPSFYGGARYTHQAEYRFQVPPDSDWVLIRGRVQGTGTPRHTATGSVLYEEGGAEQLVVWDRKAQAPVSLSSVGVALRRMRLEAIVRGAH